MPHIPSRPLWLPLDIAGCRVQGLNLTHPWVAAHVGNDMAAGIDVYYNRRWPVTEHFCHALLAHPTWVAGQTVCILGAGLGLETVIIGRLCHHLYLNDLAPGALELCADQLRHNGVTTFTCLVGRYEQLALPAVDLLVGCFVVYNRETAATMQQLLAHTTAPVLLINDPMPDFTALVQTTTRPVRSLLSSDAAPCLLFDSPLRT